MKILVVRFSSIGDIVLTSPVVRCLKQQIPNATIHFLTKKSYRPLVDNNPYIDQVYAIDKSIDECLPRLKNEKYDFVVDLHNNLRTFSLKNKLRVPAAAFPKLHKEKWLLVNFKKEMKDKRHIVDRYFEAVKSLKVVNDLLPCDFFISQADEVDVLRYDLKPTQYIAFAVGAQFATKRMPVEKMKEILSQIDVPVVLLGGPTDQEVGKELSKFSNVIDLTGKLSIGQSASVVKQSAVLLTHDTGLMHIASAFQIPIVSVWGNTVPAFGMYPYYPSDSSKFSVHEVNGLACRPCSKIGFQACPKKHFNCMQLQDTKKIALDLMSRFNSKV
ncbi:MAG: glycosyltransferase family 9 protein [Crocinitomicaceae bacterium]|nr:glycosyltransferase family 9 protein [Crocinitomicaceae bacterium]